MKVDEAKLQAFVGKMVGDMGAAMSAALVVVGDRLGLYKAMADAGPIDSAGSPRTGTSERYVREWLAGQAAAGFVTYDAASQRYSLTPEQAAVLADEGSPAFMAGGFQISVRFFATNRRSPRHFGPVRASDGTNTIRCYSAARSDFRPGYAAHLVGGWIPALTGMKEKLERGAKVADVGCGHGVNHRDGAGV